MLACVVNVSEGRRPAVLAALAAAAGPDLLDLHADRHHHRSVLTLVGEAAPRAVAAAAVAVVDLRRHTGVHPRLGAVDVVPFVALSGAPAAAVAARDRFVAWVADALRLPAFAYGPLPGGGAPAADGGVPGPTARTLPDVRRRAFRDLRPDAGPGLPHPTAGAVAVGARPPLVAYNVWLAVPDLSRARAVARAVRGPHLQALGLRVGDRVQVSMNLLTPDVVGPADAYDLVAAEAPVAGAELVGLVSEAVLDRVPEQRWAELDVDRGRTVETRLARWASGGPAWPRPNAGAGPRRSPWW